MKGNMKGAEIRSKWKQEWKQKWKWKWKWKRIKKSEARGASRMREFGEGVGLITTEPHGR